VPDALTHLCGGLLARAGWRGPMVPVFVAGAMLPDVLSRLPIAALLFFSRHVHALPDFAFDGWMPLHLPAGIVLWSLLLTMFSPEGMRRPVLGNLLAGATLHVALDLCQRHVGLGYPLLLPFSGRDLEMGIFGSEATIPWLPVLVPMTALAWWAGGRLRPGR